MMVFKRKQIVVLSLVLMVVVAGYLQYSYKKSSMSASEKDEGKLGEAVYVDSDMTVSSEDEVADKKEAEDKKASKEANNFFTQAQLDKEVAISRDTDALKEITEDVNASSDIKAEAYDKMMKIVENSQRELHIETMIKEQGYSDVIALFGYDGSIDIVVKTPSLTATQIAQIAEVVSRQAGVDMTQIHIKHKF